MRMTILRCGNLAREVNFTAANDVFDLSEAPTRQELKPIDAIAREVLPVDPTPSLDEIAMQPDAAHLGTPGPAPQPVPDPWRIVVIGTDASLSAVLTRLMRADNLWAEIGFVPVGPSLAATNWGIPSLVDDSLRLATEGVVKPAPLIRDDTAVAVAGSATVTDWDDKEISAEVIVDDDVILRHAAGPRTPARGVFGAKLVPMTDAPGLAAVVADTPIHEVPARGLGRLLGRTAPHGTAVAATLKTGRALQAGGENLRIEVDGVSRKRPVDRVTFYRHLRDLQIVRP